MMIIVIIIRGHKLKVQVFLIGLWSTFPWILRSPQFEHTEIGFSTILNFRKTYFCQLVLERWSHHHQIWYASSTDGSDQKLFEDFCLGKWNGSCRPMKFHGEATKQEPCPYPSNTLMDRHQTWWTDSKPKGRPVTITPLVHASAFHHSQHYCIQQCELLRCWKLEETILYLPQMQVYEVWRIPPRE